MENLTRTPPRGSGRARWGKRHRAVGACIPGHGPDRDPGSLPRSAKVIRCRRTVRGDAVSAPFLPGGSTDAWRSCCRNVGSLRIGVGEKDGPVIMWQPFGAARWSGVARRAGKFRQCFAPQQSAYGCLGVSGGAGSMSVALSAAGGWAPNRRRMASTLRLRAAWERSGGPPILGQSAPDARFQRDGQCRFLHELQAMCWWPHFACPPRFRAASLDLPTRDIAARCAAGRGT